MKSLNRQTVSMFKKLSVPAAIMMILSTIISGIGTFLHYKEELMPSACANGWIQYDKHCYLDTNIKMSTDNAVYQCRKLRARLPRPDTRHLRVLFSIFYKDYWVSLKKTNNKWLDINNDKDIDISKLTNFKQLNSTTDAEACYIYKSGKLVKTVCKSTQSVLCVKKFYK
ncbi:putative A34R [Vaccinia virus Copenhagen]|uniref:Protein OPG162 n=1 Tax=Vaccinia virus (strain Copenhagen) TaxID=10249 RepID=PG162_VACCC|nr:RecName: Full=Protein OPG162 [Vaccinia virus Copenhagen]AAA48161.1 putative A34R [Vaccinia virus Copenhagen]WDR17307.1 putative A34R [Vaccinia virus Copenhagen]WDR17515.1 putative A34R [Vaccinia virus Copenhagen]